MQKDVRRFWKKARCHKRSCVLWPCREHPHLQRSCLLHSIMQSYAWRFLHKALCRKRSGLVWTCAKHWYLQRSCLLTQQTSAGCWMCLEPDALWRAYGTVANISRMLECTTWLLLPTTYCTGLFVLSQASFQTNSSFRRFCKTSFFQEINFW